MVSDQIWQFPWTAETFFKMFFVQSLDPWLLFFNFVQKKSSKSHHLSFPLCYIEPCDKLITKEDFSI